MITIDSAQPGFPDRRNLPQTLLIDADDTLWENNIYFEQAIARFTTELDHTPHSPEEVREHLNACEQATIAESGYGLASFRRSLVRCFVELTRVPITEAIRNQIHAFTQVLDQELIEVLPHVEATLRELTNRHRLLLVTKGNREEQTAKLQRSGLEHFFSGVEVAEEKNTALYRDLRHRYSLEPQTAWMIGNSPRSDVNPSLAAGLNAVYIAHHSTWVLEREELAVPAAERQLLTLPDFQSLLLHF